MIPLYVPRCCWLKGIFFNVQIFDSYTFATGLIKFVKEFFVRIDNYIDKVHIE